MVADAGSSSCRRRPPGGFTGTAVFRTLLWASNWPHPNVSPRPDNQALLDWAMACMGDGERRRKVLIGNPAALYGFGPGAVDR